MSTSQASNITIAIEISNKFIRSMLASYSDDLDEDNLFFETYGDITPMSGFVKSGIQDKRKFFRSIERSLDSLREIAGYPIQNIHILYTTPSLIFQKKRKSYSAESLEHTITKKWLDSEKRRLHQAIEKKHKNKYCAYLELVSILADGEEILYDPYDFQIEESLQIHFVYVLVSSIFIETIQDGVEDIVEVESLYPSILAHTNSLTEEQKIEGIIICNVDYFCSSIAAYKDGFLQGIEVVPFGLYSILSTIASTANISMKEAERNMRLLADGSKPDIKKTILKKIDASIGAEVKTVLLPVIKKISQSKGYAHGIKLVGNGVMYQGLKDIIQSTTKTYTEIRKDKLHIVLPPELKKDSLLWEPLYEHVYGIVKREYSESVSSGRTEDGFKQKCAKFFANLIKIFH